MINSQTIFTDLRCSSAASKMVKLASRLDQQKLSMIERRYRPSASDSMNILRKTTNNRAHHLTICLECESNLPPFELAVTVVTH